MIHHLARLLTDPDLPRALGRLAEHVWSALASPLVSLAVQIAQGWGGGQ